MFFVILIGFLLYFGRLWFLNFIVVFVEVGIGINFIDLLILWYIGFIGWYMCFDCLEEVKFKYFLLWLFGDCLKVLLYVWFLIFLCWCKDFFFDDFDFLFVCIIIIMRSIKIIVFVLVSRYLVFILFFWKGVFLLKNWFFVLVFESREIMFVGGKFWGFFFVIWFFILGVCGLLIWFVRRD